MSINSALLAGVSGLMANSSALSAISDNIANVDTDGYKQTQINFADVVTAQAVKGDYSAGGVQGITHTYVSKQGLIQSTSSSTDMAVSGDGMFVVQPQSTAAPNVPIEFTREGSFTVDSNGFLVNNAGLYLQGWPVQPGGTFAPDPSDLTKLASINIKNLGAAVAPTANMGVSANLNQAGVISPGEAAYNGATNASMADYASTAGASGTKPDFTMELNVVDSVGATHKLEMAFLKDSAAPNEWHAEIYSVPATDVTGGTRPGQVASGLVTFNPDGSINLGTTTLFGAAGATPQLALGSSSAGPAPQWAAGLGLASQTVNLDMTKLTQYASASTVNSISTDGAGPGNVVGVQVSTAGIVSAIFDNSQVRPIAQVALASFPNPDALKAVSGNAYQSTIPAGQMVLKQAGVGGAGEISPSSLEASTVDLSSEFSKLIITQQAYSASSKIITTSDQMLQELINMKQ
jgi:flagellar hook protein FlgE